MIFKTEENCESAPKCFKSKCESCKWRNKCVNADKADNPIEEIKQPWILPYTYPEPPYNPWEPRIYYKWDVRTSAWDEEEARKGLRELYGRK